MHLLTRLCDIERSPRAISSNVQNAILQSSLQMMASEKVAGAAAPVLYLAGLYGIRVAHDFDADRPVAAEKQGVADMHRHGIDTGGCIAGLQLSQMQASSC